MAADLESAAREYREAQAAVVTADAAVIDARERVRTARAQLYAAVREAHAAGVRQTDIIRATGYNRETIRRIVQGGESTED